MFKDVLQKNIEQYTSKLIAFWRRYIYELEMKNPQGILPETQAALPDTQACIDDLESVGC